MTQLWGQELLGAAKYQKFAIEHLPKGRCGKTFAKEFGDSMPVLRAWAEKEVHPIVATHGLWRGGAHDYSGEKNLTEGLKELEKFIKIAQAVPEQLFQFSIFCEHKLRTPYLEKVFTRQWEMIKDVSNINLVNTPMSGGDLLKPGAFGIPKGRLLNEFHGNWNPKTAGFAPYMWACDGMPAQDCDIQYFKNLHINAGIIWLWMQQYNCKKKVDETTLIPQRKVVPVEKQVTSLEYLIPSKRGVSFNKESIYKTHADQHGNTPKGREQKPVIITPVKADKLEFIGANGNLIITAPHTDIYEDGRQMYRMPIWGYEAQDIALKKGGSVKVSVIAVKGSKRTKLGTVNPPYRQNAYRNKEMLRVEKEPKKGAESFVVIDDKLIDLDWV